MATVARPVHVNYWALWFGFLGAAAAWSVHELAALAITTHYCYPAGEPLPSPSLQGIWVTDLIVIAAAALVALGSLFTAVAQWRAYRPVSDVDWRAEMMESSGGRAARFLSFSGVLFGVVFLSMIVYSGIALFVVPLCGYH